MVSKLYEDDSVGTCFPEGLRDWTEMQAGNGRGLNSTYQGATILIRATTPHSLILQSKIWFLGKWTTLCQCSGYSIQHRMRI